MLSLALTVDPAVTVQNEPGLGVPGFSFVVMILFIASLALVWRRRRKGQDGIRRSPGGSAMGNALLDFNAVFQPHHANAAVVCKLEEEELRDDAGEGPEPWTPPPSPKPDPYRERNDQP